MREYWQQDGSGYRDVLTRFLVLQLKKARPKGRVFIYPGALQVQDSSVKCMGNHMGNEASGVRALPYCSSSPQSLAISVVFRGTVPPA